MMKTCLEVAAPTSDWLPEKIDAEGKVPESWACVDCGTNTAPRLLNRIETEQALALATSVENTIDTQSEVYTVKAKVWKAANLKGETWEAWGGCLCIGCLEKRLHRRLTPKDFMPNHPFNQPS